MYMQEVRIWVSESRLLIPHLDDRGIRSKDSEASFQSEARNYHQVSESKSVSFTQSFTHLSVSGDPNDVTYNLTVIKGTFYQIFVQIKRGHV